ncbi:transposase family protein [Streptomyces sp. NPDC001633]|uniref:transposase family protein n=1 Tax=Streptomyces sp. NPDC001633 TaxID=3364595 RepID=UPI00367CD5AE
MLACWFGVDRSTITRAIGEVRPLLAQRGCTVARGIRLRTLAEVIEYLGAGGTGIIDGTEIRVRRPAAGRKDRDKCLSGKTKQNAVKSMVLTDAEGRILFCSPVRPGSCATSPRPAAGTGPAPGRRPVHGDPCGCRLPGHGRAGWRSDTSKRPVRCTNNTVDCTLGREPRPTPAS